MSLPPVYTKLLLAFDSFSGGEAIGGYGPPVGFVWIITDICVRCVNDVSDVNAGFFFYTVAGGPVLDWYTPPYTKRAFHWSGRQVQEDVLDTNAEYAAQPVSGVSAALVVTGFLLSTA